VCLLYGGKSGEHEVSCQSAASIYRHIDRNKYDLICIGIMKNGTWHLQSQPKLHVEKARGEVLEILPMDSPISVVPGKGLFAGQTKLKTDIILPILHGTYGEDGTLQGMLEMLDIPYIGAGVLASSLCMDKYLAKRVFHEAGLPVLEGLRLNKDDFTNKQYLAIDEIEDQFTYPVFVKPVCCGSSVGASKVSDRQALVVSLKEAFRFDTHVLVERCINAREIECAVIGNDSPRVFVPGEVIPSHEFYSYEAKYLDPNGAKLTVPADLPDITRQKIMDFAIMAYRVAGVTGCSRVDLFLEHDTGEIYLNEINTLPGFTNISMFPRMCAAGGLEYADLIDTLIGYGLEIAKNKAGIEYNGV